MPRFIFTIINFLLLLLIIYLVGRKMIVNIFRGRKERINQSLDIANQALPEPEEYDPPKPEDDESHKAALEEELAIRKKKLADLKVKFENESETLRRESLLNSRSNLVQLTMDKAREYMKSEEFLQSMKDQEECASYVAQVDKSKVAIQTALDETKLLFDSLMQEYFG